MYQKGDVVIVSFPFTDGSGEKARPAVIVSGTRYNAMRSDVVLAAVTSRPPRNGLDHCIEHWEQAGLFRPSTVRAKVATMHRACILHHAGRLQESDLRGLNDLLRRMLDLDA